jgi:hypothetical protein
MRDERDTRPCDNYDTPPAPLGDSQSSKKIGRQRANCSPQTRTQPLRPPKRPQLHLGPHFVGRWELPGWLDAANAPYFTKLDATLP